MHARLSINSGVLVLAAVLVSVSAQAQTGYSHINVDVSGSVFGYSATGLNYDDSLNGLYAYVYGSLDGPAGNLGEGEGYDDGTGLALIEMGGQATVGGTYEEYGEHYEGSYYGGDLYYLGSSSDQGGYSGGGGGGGGGNECDFPQGEATSDYGWSPIGAPVRRFFMQVYEGSFEGRTVYESLAGGGYDTCFGSNIGYALNHSATIDQNNSYIDDNGYVAAIVAAIRNVATLPCGFTVYQNISMDCQGSEPYVYTTNEIDWAVDATTVTIIHSGVGGTWSY